MHVEGDSMVPTLQDGDAVLVDMTRQFPSPPGIFVLDDGMGLVAKRLEHICSIPDDHISPRRSALFMARSVLRELRDGGQPC